MPKIFLHIGVNKTGTTAIQSFFSHNREALASQGLLYPKSACTETAHYALTNVLGLNRGIDSESMRARRRKMRAALDAEISQNTPQAVLFSSEMFVRSMWLDAVGEFFKQDDLRILVYLRRHDTWWPAAYSQAIKTKTQPPWPRGINAFIRFSRQQDSWRGNYRQLLDRWAAVFGREKIIVRPYEAQQNAPDIVVDLLRTIALEPGMDIEQQLPQFAGLRSPRRNASLAPRTLQLLDAFQRAKLDPGIRERLIQHALSFSITEPSQSILSPARRLELIDENAADYEYIAREYMGREDGRLFYDPLPDPDEPWQPPSLMPQQKIVEETVAALLATKIETAPKSKRRLPFRTWFKKLSGRSL